MTENPHAMHQGVQSTLRRAREVLRDSRNIAQEGFDTSPAQRLMNRRTFGKSPKSTGVGNVLEMDDRRKERQQKYNEGAENVVKLDEGDCEDATSQAWREKGEQGNCPWASWGPIIRS